MKLKFKSEHPSRLWPSEFSSAMDFAVSLRQYVFKAFITISKAFNDDIANAMLS